MTYNIEDFKARGLKNHGARPSLFEVIMSFPAGIGTGAQGGTFVEEGGRFVISASQLPASLIDEVRVPYFGRFIKVFGNRAYQDWSVTVMNDNDMPLRQAFEEWHNEINFIERNRLSENVAGSIAAGAAPGQTYKQDLRVRQYRPEGPDSESGISREYVIVGAFPTAVNAINLAWDDVNRIEQFDVTFSYDYWFVGQSSTGTLIP